MKKDDVDGALPEPVRDGRTTRSARTRAAVIDALQALIAAGDPKPNAQRIAERAGVSTRTVFAHFASLDDLYRAAVERATALVLALLSPIDPGRPLDDRIEDLTDQRARVAEEIGPLRRAASLQEPFSPALAEARRFARQASYEQVERVFAGELATLDPGARRRCVAVVDALISGEAWDLLRQTHDLSPDEARRAVGEALRALLPAAPGAATPGAAGQAQRGEEAAARQAARTEERARRDAAGRALAEIDEKVERLVAAIEAGTPADLLAPRLQALRAAKRSAERDLVAPEAPTDADARARTRQH
jgi:AcrR family transcriptional regulator